MTFIKRSKVGDAEEEALNDGVVGDNLKSVIQVIQVCLIFNWRV